MILLIEILNDIILQGLSMTSAICEQDLQNKPGHNVENITFKYIISNYKLDFRQSVAFENMSCPFIFKPLKVQNITKDILQQFSKKVRTNIINTQIV